MAVFSLLTSGVLSSSVSYAATNTLPGGTNIEITIDSPSNGDEIEITSGTSTDVMIQGLADIGMGNPLKDTDIIYIIDVSGSMSTTSGVDCNGDGIITTPQDSRIRCAIKGIEAANNAAASLTSTISKTGLGTFNNTQKAWDVDLGTPGVQLLVNPSTDGNNNGKPDIIDVISSVTPNEFTSYGSGLQALQTILASSTSTNKIVIFLSDGQNNRAPPVSNFATTFDNQGVVFNAFAVGGGGGVDCNTPSASIAGFPLGALGNLNSIKDLTPGGTCTNVSDMSTLANLISESVGSSLTKLEIEVNGAGRTLIDNSDINPDLPVIGPAMADYSTTVSGLTSGTHSICIIASGLTAFGSGEVTECVDISVVDKPPVITVPTIPNTEATGPSGASVLFSVTATDLVDGSITPTCSATSGDTFPVGTTTVTCSASDSAGNTSVDSFFDIIVVDTTPPVITVPNNLSISTGNPSGSSVSFSVTATDLVDGSITPTCSATSGDTFPVGTTTVTCSATDSAGNTSVDSFFDITVTLSYQAQKEKQITLLLTLIDGSPKDTQKDLEKAIKSIQKSLDGKLWETPITLNEKHGNKVFDEEKSAIKDLLKIQKDSTTNVSNIIFALVSVDRNLAQDNIDKASTYASSDKVYKEIQKANDEMGKAQQKLDNNKPDDAIDHFKKAWEHAQQAIKHATK